MHRSPTLASYTFELAQPGDDAAIRRLLRENPVPGQMVLTYEREPDYFLGSAVMGPLSQTLVARQQESRDVVGIATRSVRPLFVNGRREEVGYIGQLRVDSAHRGRWIVSKGFRLFHQLHQDGRATGYYTTIIEGNREAQGLLVEKARRHFPAYRRLDRLFTLALVVRRRKRRPSTAIEVLAGDEVDLDEIVAFLQKEGRERQFFPVYTSADFTGSATRDFNPADFAVAFRQGRIVGVLGLWDQSAFKQTVVHDYRADLQRLRPLYNLGSKLVGASPLTEIGQPIHFAYASFACIAQSDPAVFNRLLIWIYNRAVEKGYTFLTLGLTESDPLLSSARKWLHIAYTSTIYSVCWPGDEWWHDRLDGRPIYVELATL